MKSLFSDQKSDYLQRLRQRGKDSRAHYSHQFLGLELAHLLGDLKHKSLYIKLAKEYDGQVLLRLAKDVLDRQGVKNPAAYFMRLLKDIPKKGSRSSDVEYRKDKKSKGSRSSDVGYREGKN